MPLTAANTSPFGCDFYCTINSFYCILNSVYYIFNSIILIAGVNDVVRHYYGEMPHLFAPDTWAVVAKITGSPSHLIRETWTGKNLRDAAQAGKWVWYSKFQPLVPVVQCFYQLGYGQDTAVKY